MMYLKKEVLFIESEDRNDLTQDEFKLVHDLINVLEPSDSKQDWLRILLKNFVRNVQYT